MCALSRQQLRRLVLTDSLFMFLPCCPLNTDLNVANIHQHNSCFSHFPVGNDIYRIDSASKRLEVGLDWAPYVGELSVPPPLCCVSAIGRRR